MFAIILRVHVTVGNPVSVFAFKVTPHFGECLQKNKLYFELLYSIFSLLRMLKNCLLIAIEADVMFRPKKSYVVLKTASEFTW